MTYAIKEIFLTLQGEGGQAGKPAVFCRFAGCNLWSGREEDREKAICRFCDTDFVGTDGTKGGRYTDAKAVMDMIEGEWTGGDHHRLIVFTGGEPLLQLDKALIEEAHRRGFACAAETNGTIEAPPGLDWICVSPKAGAPLKLLKGDELKLVYPQEGLDPAGFESLPFRHFWLQPMDGPDVAEHTRSAMDYCLKHPLWRLSVQTHKMIGIR